MRARCLAATGALTPTRRANCLNPEHGLHVEFANRDILAAFISCDDAPGFLGTTLARKSSCRNARRRALPIPAFMDGNPLEDIKGLRASKTILYVKKHPRVWRCDIMLTWVV
jgi:hypothetical protein